MMASLSEAAWFIGLCDNYDRSDRSWYKRCNNILSYELIL